MILMIIDVENEEKMKSIGAAIGRLLRGGEIIELIGDVGAGKTVLAKGIAAGLGVNEAVQSPSFTISRTYGARDGLTLSHYDFYRLESAGIMSDELAESLADNRNVTVIEWADVVAGILPDSRITIRISTVDDATRKVEISDASNKIISGIKV